MYGCTYTKGKGNCVQIIPIHNVPLVIKNILIFDNDLLLPGLHLSHGLVM